jgi:DNA recombination-dependent growth factor C
MDRLTRENEKIRGLIKKFNDELNDLINRNIMQLKSKKEEKVLPPEDVLKVLEEQRNSNETALQTALKELQRLKGKEGELK